MLKFLSLVATLCLTLSIATNAQARKPYPEEVESPYAVKYAPGTIVVSASKKELHLILSGNYARRYHVAVPKTGKQWSGEAYVDGKHVKPAWAPPKEVKRDNPNIPDYIPGGDPSNPMGAAALTLDRDELAIHGTNRPDSIGKAASYGCIRMYNEDINDLFGRVDVGTRVVMVK